MKFVCRNEDCKRCGVVYEYLKNRMKLIDGKLVSDNAPCPSCGNLREEVEDNRVPLSEKNIAYGKFASASKEEKRAMLKKRSHEHFKKEIKEQKEHRIREAIGNFKGGK